MADTTDSRRPPVTTVLSNEELPDNLTEMTDDEAGLAALGYKQEFKVTTNKPPTSTMGSF